MHRQVKPDRAAEATTWEPSNGMLDTTVALMSAKKPWNTPHSLRRRLMWAKRTLSSQRERPKPQCVGQTGCWIRPLP